MDFVTDACNHVTSVQHITLRATVRLNVSTVFWNSICDINFDQDDWVKWSALAEFRVTRAIGVRHRRTRHFIDERIDPRINFLVEGLDGPQSSEARARTLTLKERRDEAVEQAQAYQKAYYGSKHRPVSFHEGDLVWLDLRNITSVRPSKKLDLRRYGPCVVQKVGSQAYRLELPVGLNVYNVFHVSLLRKHHELDGVDSNAHHPLRHAPDEHREYQVHSIVDSMKDGRRILYRVHWQGYDQNDEPDANVRHLRRKLHEFHRTNPDKPGIREFTRT
jgi:hypothetical protein